MLLVGLALLVQVTLVNRVPLPGGEAPDLVLLVVVACAAQRGPVAGAVIGFGTGLAVDLLPPAHHVAGQCALVFCLIGFLVGRMVERTAAAVVPAAILAAVAAPLLAAAVAALIGTPGITGTAMLSRLPGAVVCNLLAAPLVVWGVGRLFGRTRRGEHSVRPPVAHSADGTRGVA
ncbi:rod shape-determining protein MreD [Spongiactinospora sp. TRM90649]|uniref:rod shape-determining protein MreD n=1 Tax=Spongiactinospora sp. TRM90649 TaxID=3031114 RepID=UPI0023F9CE2A|nr:rod shape-determining protein MreD [Spongiactinospora sp. TRM90649]MDF5755260.1 rod shape-determining protein MreD [Spongiactinospora sp. TRM90649]